MSQAERETRPDALAESGPRPRCTILPGPDPFFEGPFRTLRSLARELGCGGLPPLGSRSAEDSARIAVFCAVQELVHLVDELARGAACGEERRLTVFEHGRDRSRVIIEIRLEPAPRR